MIFETITLCTWFTVDTPNRSHTESHSEVRGTLCLSCLKASDITAWHEYTHNYISHSELMPDCNGVQDAFS